MKQHSRKPVLVILLASGLVSGATVVAMGALTEHRGARPTLAQLETAVAHENASVDVWLAYADRLQEAGQYAHAADAYQKALEKNSLNRAARLGLGVALARAGNAAGLYAWVQKLMYSDPGLTCELLDRPECAPFLTEDRFVQLRQEAKLQTMD